MNLQLASPENRKQVKLPYLGLESQLCSTRQLQKMSGAALEELRTTGPRIIVINGLKKAVLVDFDQYNEFQNVFKTMFSLLSKVPAVCMPAPPPGYSVEVEELKVQIKGTLRKIVSESPETSPLAELFDSIMGLASGLFQEAESAPRLMLDSARATLNKTARKVEKKGAKPKRPNIG